MIHLIVNALLEPMLIAETSVLRKTGKPKLAYIKIPQLRPCCHKTSIDNCMKLKLPTGPTYYYHTVNIQITLKQNLTII